MEWKTPWFLLSLFASLNLLISPVMTFLQGLHKVKEWQYFTYNKKIAIICSVMIGLLFGFKLGVCAINSFTGFIGIIVSLFETRLFKNY